MTDKPFNLWLPIENDFRKNPYREFLERVSNSNPTYNEWMRGCLPELDHRLLHDMLRYWIATDEPPPEILAVILLVELMKSRAGHKSSIFAKPRQITKQSAQPMTTWLEQNAVLYYKACKTKRWDKTPVKTLKQKCGVDKGTVHRWIKKYDNVEFNDDFSREEIDNILYALKSTYPRVRYR